MQVSDILNTHKKKIFLKSNQKSEYNLFNIAQREKNHKIIKSIY